MADENTFKEKLRSLQFQGQKAAPKVTKHVTDTAVVTETERDTGQDTHVRLTSPATLLPSKKE